MNGEAARKTYYSISEVCEMTGLEAHVLRYWESEFPQLHPKKNRAGNRAYRDRDIELINYIKFLLYEEQYTIPGARRKCAHIRDREEFETEAAALQPPGSTPPLSTPPSAPASAPALDLVERKQLVKTLRDVVVALKGLG
jgi:hypothetical protein